MVNLPKRPERATLLWGACETTTVSSPLGLVRIIFFNQKIPKNYSEFNFAESRRSYTAGLGGMGGTGAAFVDAGETGAGKTSAAAPSTILGFTVCA